MTRLSHSGMTRPLIRIALLYALLGIAMGIAMAAQKDFTNKGVHVHINLVGWVSMALMGVIYHVFPAMARSPLAKVHFWLHNIGLPLMAGGLYGLMHRWPAAEPVVGSGSILVALAFAVFAFNAWLNAGETTQAEGREEAMAVRLNRPAAGSAIV